MSKATLLPIADLSPLAALRKAADLTTREVGNAMGLSHARIVQIESIGTKDMDQEEQLAKIYGVELDVMRTANRETKNRSIIFTK